MDLDLPELEDVPTYEATVSAKGELEIKKRTQASARAVYAQCVFGMGIFVAANLFNRAPTVRFITMSAFTQRKDAQGEPCDDYIYSVKLERSRFEEADLAEVGPEAFLLGFENRCSLSKTKVFKAIAPYEVPPLNQPT